MKSMKLPRPAKSADDARALLTDMFPLFRLGCGVLLPGGGMRVTMTTGLTGYTLTVPATLDRVDVREEPASNPTRDEHGG